MRRLLKKGSALTNRASGRSRAKVAKAASISPAGAGVDDLDLQPHGASSRFHFCQRGFGTRALVGLTSTATRVAAGTSSRSSSSRFAAHLCIRRN